MLKKSEQGRRAQKALPLTRAKIGVLMGGDSPERAVSLQTGRAICQALQRRGYRVMTIDVDASLPWKLRANKIALAFLALHGPGGEDGTVQGLLEILRIPYTGSGVRASALAMDKPKTKSILKAQGIPVAKGEVFHVDRQPRHLPSALGLPVVVKPAAQGSTIGISIVRRTSEWRKALARAYEQDEEVLVESYVSGREVAVSVLDGKALPPVEIRAPGGFYDYAAKYEKKETQYLCPPPLSTGSISRLQNLAVRSYVALGCEGVARVDFRLNQKGHPYVLEVNTIPGMTQRSLLPMAAAEAGIDYESLSERILQSALRKKRGYGVKAKPTFGVG